MFTNLKKDFYSVNAGIALSPLDEQQMLQNILQQEHNNTVQAMQNYEQSDGGDSQNLQYATENMIQESQHRINIIADKLQNPVSTKYDDIYHPRTDLRVISKYTRTSNSNFRGQPVHLPRKRLQQGHRPRQRRRGRNPTDHLQPRGNEVPNRV